MRVWRGKNLNDTAGNYRLCYNCTVGHIHMGGSLLFIPLVIFPLFGSAGTGLCVLPALHPGLMLSNAPSMEWVQRLSFMPLLILLLTVCLKGKWRMRRRIWKPWSGWAHLGGEQWRKCRDDRPNMGTFVCVSGLCQNVRVGIHLVEI